MVNAINAGSGRNGGMLTLVYLAVLDQSFGYGAVISRSSGGSPATRT
jgi:hypothetical protein